MPTRNDKYKMLEALREACEGKMFLEREYAQSTMKLCSYLEEDKKSDEATEIIQEIQIETYGSLEVKEKLEFILYQMKLTLARKDFVRMQILSRKISKRHMSAAGLEEMKIQFYKFMIFYYVHEKMTMECAQAYQTIYDTIMAAKEGEERQKLDPSGQFSKDCFNNFLIYLIITPHDKAKVDLLKTVQTKYARELEATEKLASFVNKLLTSELYPLNESEITQDLSRYSPFQDSTENHVLHTRSFIQQLIQHNIRVIEKFYSRIRIRTLANLIGVTEDRAEQEICDMVVNKRVQAKINRLEWQVVFGVRSKTGKGATENMLEAWNKDLKTMLQKVENTCHLINREKMISSK